MELRNLYAADPPKSSQRALESKKTMQSGTGPHRQVGRIGEPMSDIVSVALRRR
jgi:hypothetical protein